MSASFEARLAMVRERMVRACARANRPLESVRLLPVTKTVEPYRIREAVEAGLTVFGENRVQEARRKIPLCPDRIEWHLIGHLQSNKVKLAVSLFSCIHSVDSQPLLTALEETCARAGRRLPIFLEVNVAGEATKFGFAPEDVIEAVRAANACPHLEVVGLMTIPPFVPDREAARPFFRRLRLLRDEVAQAAGTPLPELSMGMSHDFEIAIEEGATWIRVGTALFGPRSSPSEDGV
jgi:hypothetical protein